jgi:hypothetical protein
MDRPPPDPVKLLSAWMEWERGETTPGRTMATLKTGGLRTVLEDMATTAQADPDAGAGAAGEGAAGEAQDGADPAPQEAVAQPESWTPVV